MQKIVLKHFLFLMASGLLGCSEEREPAGQNSEDQGATGSLTVGLYDDRYFDGHLHKGQPTPILPPGRWDWNSEDRDLANWKNFKNKIGTFRLMHDQAGQAYGWELISKDQREVDYTGSAAYFEGSGGDDWIKLGPKGKIHSFTGTLAGGNDLLVFNTSWSLDFSTGGGQGAQDQDLVVAGCDENDDGSFDIKTTSIHTGPGADLMFVRDAERSGFDAGNREGRTSELDPDDGHDTVVFRGNMLDFRFYGGHGNDHAVWFADEVHQTTSWLGPNFFGGGGAGKAIWGDPGIDRLVLVIPSQTAIIGKGPVQPGQLLLHVLDKYKTEIQWDGPTSGDAKASYCITCGVSEKGRKTLTLEYRSASNHVRTGYFWITAFEELQIGLGPDAKVYELDDVNGTAVLKPGRLPLEVPELDASHCRARNN